MLNIIFGRSQHVQMHLMEICHCTFGIEKVIKVDLIGT